MQDCQIYSLVELVTTDRHLSKSIWAEAIETNNMAAIDTDRIIFDWDIVGVECILVCYQNRLFDWLIKLLFDDTCWFVISITTTRPQPLYIVRFFPLDTNNGDCVSVRSVDLTMPVSDELAKYASKSIIPDLFVFERERASLELIDVLINAWSTFVHRKSHVLISQWFSAVTFRSQLYRVEYWW